MSLIGGAAIAAGATIASMAGNAIATGKMNKRAVKYAREAYDKQRGHNLEDWHMQNAYNDPSAQMQRLKNAGLNENLVYGNGATTEAGMARGATAPVPDLKTPNFDIGGVALNALQARQIQSNIARTDAETKAIEAKTAGTQFQNQLNDAIGIQKMVDNYSWAADKVATESQKANAEYEAFISGAFDGKTFDDKNSPVAKAIKAGYQTTVQKLENDKKLGDIRAYETTIKQFEAGLAKQGISPNSPWFVKIIGDLLTKTLGFSSIHQLSQTLNSD